MTLIVGCFFLSDLRQVSTVSDRYISSVQCEMNQETQRSVDMMDRLEKESTERYHPDPQPGQTVTPPKVSLIQRAGYLYLRR